MLITVQANGRMRRFLGGDQVVLELPVGAKVGDLRAALGGKLRDFPLGYARDGRMAFADESLRDGDTIVLLVALGGG